MGKIINALLFCDGSVDRQTRRGCGAYLLTDDRSRPSSILSSAIRTHIFTNTSSTHLELQTLLWALAENPQLTHGTLITDSQNTVGLLARRKTLEAQAFCSKKGVPLAQADLYRSFFASMDQRCLHLVKVRGHTPKGVKTDIEQIFTLVDQAARRGCRAQSKH